MIDAYKPRPVHTAGHETRYGELALREQDVSVKARGSPMRSHGGHRAMVISNCRLTEASPVQLKRHSARVISLQRLPALAAMPFSTAPLGYFVAR